MRDPQAIASPVPAQAMHIEQGRNSRQGTNEAYRLLHRPKVLQGTMSGGRPSHLVKTIIDILCVPLRLWWLSIQRNS